MHFQKVELDKLCNCGSDKAFKDCCFSKITQWSVNNYPDEYFQGPNMLTTIMGNHKLRFVFNKVHTRPKEEHIHVFLHNCVLWTMGEGWHKGQVNKKPEERHVIMKWIYSHRNTQNELIDLEYKPEDKVLGTGDGIALLSLGSDLLYLEMVNQFPEKIIKKLRSDDLFQGARYEIAIAAALVRVGFDINWIEGERSKKHHEFDAKHKHTKETIAVEAKSKHRKGVLNRAGEAIKIEDIKLDILGLYNEAMEQNPGDKPFVVFIDLNLPSQIEADIPEKKWVQELCSKIMEKQDNFFGNIQPNLLILTNFAWHYEGNAVSKEGEYGIVIPPNPTHPLNPITLEALKRAVSRFTFIPDEPNV